MKLLAFAILPLLLAGCAHYSSYDNLGGHGSYGGHGTYSSYSIGISNGYPAYGVRPHHPHYHHAPPRHRHAHPPHREHYHGGHRGHRHGDTGHRHHHHDDRRR